MNINRSYKRELRVWFVMIFMTLPLLFSDVQAEVIKTVSSAINKAGRQRMLTQRIVKAYTMIGLDVQADAANEQLLTSVELFERQLSELKRFSHDEKTNKSLSQVKFLWEPFKRIALGTVSKNGIQELIAKDDALLQAAHQVVVDLQQSANSKLGRLVNISGRQRMLSQRIAKYYMLAAWNIDEDTSYKTMLEASNEFISASDELVASKINTQEIKNSLDDVQVQWSLFERSFRLKTGNYIPLLIAMSSEKMLTKMNKVTGLYDKLGK